MDIRAWAERWLRNAAHRLRPNTLRNYTACVTQQIVPLLGTLALTAVTREDIARFVDELNARGLAPGSVRLAVGILRTLFADAVDCGVLHANPATRLARILPRHKGPHRVRAMTREERDRMLEWVKQHATRLHMLFVVLSRAGLRIGEGLGLQWADCDLIACRVLVQRTWHGRQGGDGAVKNDRPRIVELSAQTADLLLAWRQKRRNAWLFPGPGGEPWSRSHVEAVMRKAVRALGLQAYTPHSYRHTAASLLISAGEHPEYVRRMLGHASIAFTMRVYGSHLPMPRSSVLPTLDD